MAKFRTLDDLDVVDRRVLVRCDLNVPMKDGKVTDATRVERSALTLRQLQDELTKHGGLGQTVATALEAIKVSLASTDRPSMAAIELELSAPG